MLFGKPWKVGRIAGVDIRIDPSWLLIAALIAWVFWVRIDELYADVGDVGGAVLAVGAALVFFASVLVHELAHSLVARARGIEVQGITLFLFGGATESRVESKEARDELLIAVVGPLTSLAIAGVLALAAAGAGSTADAVPGMIGYLAWLNLALAVFNILPGFPLDGGRVLRAIVWWATDDLDRATHIAATAGQTLGYMLIALGLLSVLAGAFGGIWIAAIGWFLSQAARASEAQTLAEHALAGVRVRDLMSTDLVTIPAETTLTAAVDRWFLRHDHGSFPVTRDGEIVGLLGMRAVRRVPAARRTEVTAADAMLPLDELPVVDDTTPMSEVLPRLAPPGTRALVRVGGEVVGLLSPTDVTRRLQRWSELHGGGTGR